MTGNFLNESKAYKAFAKAYKNKKDATLVASYLFLIFIFLDT